jgi:uncharacterized protein DUF5683
MPSGLTRSKRTRLPANAFVFGFMKWRYFTAFLMLIYCAHPAAGQVPDSLMAPAPPPAADTLAPAAAPIAISPADTAQVKIKKKRFIRRYFEDYPNPNKALYAALVIPGGGQIYNKRWWKVPLAAAGYVAMIAAIGSNTKNYKRLSNAYIAELNGLPHEFDNTRLDAGDLKRIRDGYDKNKQLSYIGLFGVHLLVTAEAFVDSHLRSFDVSDDLSFKIKPALGALASGDTYLGVGIALQLK